MHGAYNMGVSVPIKFWVVTSKKWAVIKANLGSDIKWSEIAVSLMEYNTAILLTDPT